MRRMLSLVVFIGAFGLQTVALAEDCNTSCGDQCRVKLAFPPLEFVEPTCNLKCETFKQASCVLRAPLPAVPMTPVEVTQVFGTLTCTLPQQTVLQYFNSKCGSVAQATAAVDSKLIEAAKARLIESGLLLPRDFEGVTFSFCDAGSDGIAPDRDRVIFHSDWRLRAGQSETDFARFGALMVHEMTHVRQYREWGTDKFKCDYARQYVECGFCQDRNHSIERAAYEAQDAALSRLHYAGRVLPTPAGDRTELPTFRETFALQASQVSEKTSTGLGNRNVSFNCGAPRKDGYVCSDDKTAPTLVVYDLRRNHLALPEGSYIVEIEYSSLNDIPKVALHANGESQLLNFPKTDGLGMNARKTIWAQVSFSGGRADFIVDRGGSLPSIRGFVFRKLAD